MDIESVREYCLSLPMTTEDMAFGEDCLLFRVCNKIFVCVSLADSNYFVMKCEPEYALELHERYSVIKAAWHWNKRYWNQLPLNGSINNNLILSLIRHSYSEVVNKLPKHIKIKHPEVLDVH